ncbi:MAG: hypothetical protein C4305_02500, partial [Thermoleophilia bacterium]
GYALEAVDGEESAPLSPASVGRFLGELEIAPRAMRAAVGLGQERILDGYAMGRELVVEREVVALAALPSRA